MKKKDIDQFEILQGQLQSFYEEMNTLAKKSPNDALNKFKLGLVNSVLQKTNTFLGKTRKPFIDFENFDEAAIPTTSDVLVMISQYLRAFEKLRTENIYIDLGNWYWSIDEDPAHKTKMRTNRPKHLG
jgi:hypothetical protein